MAAGVVSFMLMAMLGLGLVLIAGGIVLLVTGLRRHDDSTSRPFLAFGVGLLIIGTVVLMPALLLGARLVLGVD